MNNKSSQLVLSFGLITILSGCAAPVIDLEPVRPSEGMNFTIRDERPEDSRKLLANPCDVSPVTRLGDENFSPPRMQVLYSRLKEKLGERLDGREIAIQRFDTIVLRTKSCQVSSDQALAQALMALAVAVFMDPSFAAGAAAHAGASSEGEGDLVSCRIEGIINGYKFVGKSAVEAKEGPTDKWGIDGRYEEISSAVSQAIDMSIERIDEWLRVEPDPEKQ